MKRLQRIGLQAFRLGLLVAVAWILRAHHVHLRVSGLHPVTVAEVSAILPDAADLRDDPGERSGVFIHNSAGNQIGYAVRTAPVSDHIVGYRGWTDTLVVFDPSLHVLGVRIRSSQDTRDHVGDVTGDPYYLQTWNGKPWRDVAKVTPEEAGIEGVSGATMTSLAVAEGIQQRLLSSLDAMAVGPPPLRVRARDIGLALITVAGTVLALAGTHGRPALRLGFQLLVISYIGFINGDLLAQSLFVGWAQNGVPWQTAPGLALLLAAALIVPWVSGKPVYCQQLCPHGAAQEIIHRVAPRSWRWKIRADVDRALRWLAPGLLAVILIASIMLLPIDLADLEPFDAYLLRSAGWATIAIALAGLILAAFVPMGYCRYGCPTGALLTFLRAHGTHDRFSARDSTALFLTLLAALLSWNYHSLHALLLSD
jgi:NosR/NirI family nitrous oxide reductase transcriptional regulator